MAKKQLESTDDSLKKKIIAAIMGLETEPKRKRAGADIKKLAGIKGKPDLYRLRVGKYRIVYEVSEGTVWISEIVKRENAYRFL